MTDLPRIVYHGRDELLDPELEWSNPEAVSDPVALVLKEDHDAVLQAARAVLERITPTMEGSVDGDYLGGALYHSDQVIGDLRAAIAKAEAEG